MYRNYSSIARNYKSPIERSILGKQKPSNKIKKEWSFENDRWDEITKRINRLKKCVTTKQSLKTVDKENFKVELDTELELQRLRRFSLSEDYVRGLVKIIVSHCDKCPSLLKDISAFNGDFIQDNQFK